MEKSADEKKFLLRFIKTYQCLEALWNIKIEAYCNKEEKRKQYDILLDVYKEQFPIATVDDVKKKINVLRTNYRREKVKLAACNKTGAGVEDCMESDLFYYKALQFLNDVQNPCPSKSTITTLKENLSKPQKRQADPAAALLELATKRYATIEQSTTTTITNGWAVMLDRMIPEQRLLSEKFISQILYEGQMGTLHKNSQTLNPEQRNIRSMNSTPFPSSSSATEIYSEKSSSQLACTAIVLQKKRTMNKKKKLWMQDTYIQRKPFTHENLLKDLKVNSKDGNCNFLRMDSEIFDELLCMVTPLIEKKDTVMRQAISPNMRLSATLRYLATGEKFEDLKFLTAISPRSLGTIIIETCEAIISSLSNYIKEPQSESEWKDIADGFNEYCNFPNCIGAIDGKHIAIKKPPHSGSLYYNYKKFFSVVLMATVNANYEFVVADVSTNGRISDGGVLKNTDFGKALDDKSLFLPPPSQLPNSEKVLPYVFVADDAFQMQENLLKPYSSVNLSEHERIFNYRLSRARRIVENVFGILVSRFGVLQTTIAVSPEKTQTIVLACCYLHNFLRKKKMYAFNDIVDKECMISGDFTEGTWRKNVQLNSLESTTVTNFSIKAKDARNNFADYFNNEGAVSWQYRN